MVYDRASQTGQERDPVKNDGDGKGPRQSSTKDPPLAQGLQEDAERQAAPGGQAMPQAGPSKEAGQQPVAEGQPAQEQVQGNGAKPPQALVATVEAEDSRAQQIRELLDQGYTFEQIRDQFKFSESTIRKELKRRLKPEGQPALANGEPAELPVVVKGSEVITPESIMERFLKYGGKDWELRLEGMMLLRAAQKMVREDVAIMREQVETSAKLMDSIEGLMRETRAEQDAALKRSQHAQAEVAGEAAQQAAGRVAGYFAERLTRIEEKVNAPPVGSNPMIDMMARVMEPYLKNVLGVLLGGKGGAQEGQQGQRSVPGFTYEPAKGGGNG